ncbi:hypothetical protein H9Y04_32730 [Streptomyces sp. TRM66268-LWL]|uniref:DUF6234 domain-containing protein n=1 Tax=Streptomyces polyasparticus TaxID=2767826 RepID=A0ABR7SPJ9_9ACTN|nr:DUF6234 family protein [Streptomyces polyasparticus]MBC9717304.1 hypothetical protein [Streptomyces polyasparticus]
MPADTDRHDGCADALIALLMVIADIVALAAAALWAALRGLGRGTEDAGGGKAVPGTAIPAAAPPVPPMDWTPVVMFGAVCLTLTVLTIVFWRGGLRITAWAQGAFALLAALAVCVSAAGEYDRAHPEPSAPTSPYIGTYGQCRSGGDSHECPGG